MFDTLGQAMVMRWNSEEMGKPRPLVAIINTSEEVSELVAMVLQHEGIRTVSAYTLDFKRGRQDLEAFLENYDPPVIVYDIAIPYPENWAFLQRVRASPAASGRRFVITTTNKQALSQFVGETDVREIIGKPFDLDELVAAVRRALTEQGYDIPGGPITSG
jgi:DNA-binding response OmpR family regulator